MAHIYLPEKLSFVDWESRLQRQSKIQGHVNALLEAVKEINQENFELRLKIQELEKIKEKLEALLRIDMDKVDKIMRHAERKGWIGENK